MGKRDAPSRHDRKGVKRARTRADVEAPRLGLTLAVPNRAGTAGLYFSAHTRRTLPTEPTNPRPTRYRSAATDLATVHVLCRCGAREIPMRADVAAAGWIPRCSIACEVQAARGRAAEIREGLRATRVARRKGTRRGSA